MPLTPRSPLESALQQSSYQSPHYTRVSIRVRLGLSLTMLLWYRCNKIRAQAPGWLDGFWHSRISDLWRSTGLVHFIKMLIFFFRSIVLAPVVPLPPSGWGRILVEFWSLCGLPLFNRLWRTDMLEHFLPISGCSYLSVYPDSRGATVRIQRFSRVDS